MTPRDVSIMLWQDGHLHEIQRIYQGRPVTIWVPCEQYLAFERQLDAPECLVSCAPRQEREKPWTTDRTSVLWAVLQTPAAGKALERFRPAPSYVLRAGRSSLRWALWALSTPLRGAFIQQATERVAYALHGLRRAASPESLIPSPFTSFEGRKVYVEFEDPRFLTARQVVGHLRDAPALGAWRNGRKAT